MTSSPDMDVVWFQPEDSTGLLKLLEDVVASITNRSFFNWTPESFRSELSHSRAVLVKQHGVIQSFILFREQIDLIEIMALGTRKSVQKNALMSQLLGFLQQYAAQQDKTIHLEVHEDNGPARRLYLKNSFQQSHVRKNYYPDGGAAVLYLWKKRAQVE